MCTIQKDKSEGLRKIRRPPSKHSEGVINTGRLEPAGEGGMAGVQRVGKGLGGKFKRYLGKKCKNCI